MATSIGSFESVQRRFEAPPSLTTAISYAITAHVLYYFNTATNYVRWLKEKFGAIENAPDLVKSYACRPKLSVRIFVPRSYDQSSKQMLPTLFTVHGGGFVLGNARDVDHWNRAFADNHLVLVVSLNYSKGPVARFPVPIYDLEQVILAALTDPALPIDQHRVGIAGFSAGGNLALSVSTLPSMCGSGDGIRRIKVAIPLYPVVDMSMRRNQKLQTRRYKPSLGGFRAKPTDFLLRLSPIFNWAYTPKGQDLQDPLLSPIFAQKDRLPRNVFVVGCELDMLAGESWRMICGLTGHPTGDERVGREEENPVGKLKLDDERYSFEVRKDDGSYKWLLIPDQIHGFDHYKQMQRLHKDEKLARDAALKTKECQTLIGEWLFTGPFAQTRSSIEVSKLS